MTTFSTKLVGAALALGCALTAVPATAQSDDAGRGERSRSDQQMALKLRQKLGALDVNHDNRISQAEWAARKDKKSGKGDGAGRAKDPAKAFAKVDADHNGYVSVAELNSFVQRKVNKMDRNHDGTITRDERQARHDKKSGKGDRGNYDAQPAA